MGKQAQFFCKFVAPFPHVYLEMETAISSPRRRYNNKKNNTQNKKSWWETRVCVCALFHTAAAGGGGGISINDCGHFSLEGRRRRSSVGGRKYSRAFFRMGGKQGRRAARIYFPPPRFPLPPAKEYMRKLNQRWRWFFARPRGQFFFFFSGEMRSRRRGNLNWNRAKKKNCREKRDYR